MAESTQLDQCELSCQCADTECRKYELRIDHTIGQSAIVVRNGEHQVEVTVDGMNKEKSFKLNDNGQELRVWTELSSPKIKAVRFRTAKNKLFCN